MCYDDLLLFLHYKQVVKNNLIYGAIYIGMNIALQKEKLVSQDRIDEIEGNWKVITVVVLAPVSKLRDPPENNLTSNVGFMWQELLKQTKSFLSFIYAEQKWATMISWNN